MCFAEEKIKNEIIKHMPGRFYKILRTEDFADLREIRLRCGQKIMLYYGGETLPCGDNLLPDDIGEIFESFCKSSVYAYLDEIKNGFITLSGGHRIGICGECTVSGGEITNIHKIYGINIRIAREFIGCSANLMPYIKRAATVKNTILIAPPACGKTTILRDIARILSERMKVTVIDERDELCSLADGAAQFNIGPQTDVLSKAPKSVGMIMALRSLSPDVIITDEVGTKDDIRAMQQALGAGCKIITSIHGYSAESIKKSKGELLSLFDVVIELRRENGVPKVVRIAETEDITND